MARTGTEIASELAARYAEIFTERFRDIDGAGWRKPWITASHPAQNIRGTAYTRSNQLLLSLLTEIREWRHPLFMTSGQAHMLGVRVSRGGEVFSCDYIPQLVQGCLRTRTPRHRPGRL